MKQHVILSTVIDKNKQENLWSKVNFRIYFTHYIPPLLYLNCMGAKRNTTRFTVSKASSLSISFAFILISNSTGVSAMWKLQMHVWHLQITKCFKSQRQTTVILKTDKIMVCSVKNIFLVMPGHANHLRLNTVIQKIFLTLKKTTLQSCTS